ncbi:uncharacterized protein LOC130725777 [Lotus japonicus]|uniref:uncharacterized protein LOC130725777 n=1 Tax=Lotus japonicus TaxID=34305 RepID=UPI00258DB211|nr:uncharacterized protein LOC130725777 [Lotus japonicus]
MIGFEEFKLISWNVRGALYANGKLAIRELVRSKKPDVFILMETRCQFRRVSAFWNSLGFFPIHIEEARGFSGGIWVLANTSVPYNFRVIDTHQQVVTFEVWKDNLTWVCSAVYASPIPANREILWRHMTLLRRRFLLPWLLLGDFNEILFPSEVRGGDFLPNRAAMFASVLDTCQLVDLGAVGRRFTWFRKANDRLILSKRLDRALGDMEWKVAFPDAVVDVLNRVHSDHCPILLQCGSPQTLAHNRPFRFLAAWADHPDFAAVVDNAWRSGEECITSKLERVREASTVFNKEVFGNIFRRKRHVEARLRGVQRELDRRVTSDMVLFEAELQREYRNILRQEELL